VTSNLDLKVAITILFNVK